MNAGDLENFLKENNQPKFRFGQIMGAVFRDGVSSFSEISALPQNLRLLLEKKMKILPFRAEKILVSQNKLSAKALLALPDGNRIETVLISPKPGIWSACLSVQAGCPSGCVFCATGKGGFKRNLTAEEIGGQVLFWKQYVKKEKTAGSFSTLVLMGMGEPFRNWENVKEALREITRKDRFGFGQRSVSVSTVGIPEGIKNLAEDFPQMNLALSLHFADNEKRSRYIPMNKKHNLEDLKKALEKYLEKTGRKVFLEYALMENVNDGKEDLKKLVEFVKSVAQNYLLHVNLIPYNDAGNVFRPSRTENVRRFKNALLKNRIGASVRKSLGEDIRGACGQLAGK